MLMTVKPCLSQGRLAIHPLLFLFGKKCLRRFRPVRFRAKAVAQIYFYGLFWSLMKDKFSPMRAYLDFEKPVAELDARIEELQKLAAKGDLQALREDISKLEVKANQALKDLYAALTPWQKTQVARHPERPHLSHYIAGLIEDFTPLAGDRHFGEDAAIVGGFGRFKGQSVCIMGQEKGVDTESRLRHNFGMAMPEGYRKAVRLMELADKFDIPILSLVDTAGAYPGIAAEERGQAEAIAQSIAKGMEVGVPSVCVVIGEGGSVLMLEHSIYTVASPEASASILWRDSTRAQDAATNMKITAQDLMRFGVIDGIIKEPAGGAHRDPTSTIRATGEAIAKSFTAFAGKSRDEIRKARSDKFLAIGRKL
jgi:acetyl-CoA carboxylase carboxyl transferase subunit alpha